MFVASRRSKPLARLIALTLIIAFLIFLALPVTHLHVTVETTDELFILTGRWIELVGRGIVLHDVWTMVETVCLLVLSLSMLWWLPRSIRIIHL